VDARLHHLQRKTGFVTAPTPTLPTSPTLPTGTRPLIQEFYREKLAAMLQHQAHARLVGQYDANNTYQYIVNREDVQVGWLTQALADLGGLEPAPVEPPAVTSATDKDPVRTLFEADARAARAFVERWRPRVDAMTNARHRGMLRVILGETLEQQRFFEQALAGRTDLLGRRGDTGGPAQGAVLASRWIE
jgi:hypothetical protein